MRDSFQITQKSPSPDNDANVSLKQTNLDVKNQFFIDIIGIRRIFCKSTANTPVFSKSCF